MMYTFICKFQLIIILYAVIHSIYPLNLQDLLQLLIDAKGEKNEEGTGCPLHNDSSKSLKNGLSDERVTQLAVGNVLGGYENVAVALGYLSYLLATNPDIQEKLQSEIDEYFLSKPVKKFTVLQCHIAIICRQPL